MDAWQRVAAHRNRIADIVESLDAEQLATPSLCEGWTVQHVAGHLTSGWNIGLGKFALGVLKKRGNFHAANIEFGRELGSVPANEIAADLRAHATDQWTPPGSGVEAPLSDAWIHALDMCVPLGIDYEVEVDDVMPIADLMVQKKSRRVRLNDFEERFSWRATDTDWAHTSAGAPEFSGPVAALILALYGRGDALGQLEGPVDQL